MIRFRLDQRSGVSTYLQLVHQVRHALRLGMLSPGDQLPTVKEVVATLAINPNTVLKAYRELEHDGARRGPPGRRARSSCARWARRPGDALASCRALERWIAKALPPASRRTTSRRPVRDVRFASVRTRRSWHERGVVADGSGKRTGAAGRSGSARCRFPRAGSPALVGPNGAGKTTLLQPRRRPPRADRRAVQVLGGPPARTPALSPGSGSSPRTRRLYAGLHGRRDMLASGAQLNPRWDDVLAHRRARAARIPPATRSGSSPAGSEPRSRSTLALAKRPELLLLDEPSRASIPSPAASSSAS